MFLQTADTYNADILRFHIVVSRRQIYVLAVLFKVLAGLWAKTKSWKMCHCVIKTPGIVDTNMAYF